MFLLAFLGWERMIKKRANQKVKHIQSGGGQIENGIQLSEN
jgi:hypothetical protein